MKLALVQLEAQAGNLAYNLANHIKWLNKLKPYQPNLIVFPELSLSGYEPALAAQLLDQIEQLNFTEIDTLAQQLDAEIWIGVPKKGTNKPKIGLRITKANGTVAFYCKRILHADEHLYFENSKEIYNACIHNNIIKPTICYETFSTEIALELTKNQPDVLIASVAKSQESCKNATTYLKELATKTTIGLGMVNAIGKNDTYVSGGLTAFWDASGKQLGTLSAVKESILLIDTFTRAVEVIY